MVSVPTPELARLLALFSGFFLYIGASELLPHSHAKRPHVSTIAATLLGLALIYTVVRLAGG
jgi:ZIP family zinc transporter